MSFIDERFPEKWALDAVRSILWVNEIVATRNQRESRNSPFAFPRYEWDLSMSAKVGRARAEFDDWFLVMRGQEHTFPLRDPADYTMPRQVIASGDGATKEFQLIKTHTVGAASFDREILTPVTSSVRVWVNDVEQVSGWSAGRTTGKVTLTVAPADEAVIEAACTFDMRVRFNQPRLDWKIAGKNVSKGYLWVCPGLKLIEAFGE